MGSSTIQALAAARRALSQATGAGLTLGRDLIAAETVIADAAQLRSALADGAADATAKAKVVDTLFAKSSAGARTVLRAVVAARWSSETDLLAGIEELAIRAIAAAAPKADTVLAELAAVGAAVSSEPELEFAVGSALVSGERKAEVVQTLLGGKTSEPTVLIVSALVRHARGRRIGELLKLAADLVADESGQLVATVQTARELAPAQLGRLQQALTAAQGRPVALNQVVDPSLIGGLKVTIGDTVIDGSVATKLSDLRLALAG